MKTWLACLLFVVAAGAKAQAWHPLADAWTRIDGGVVVGGGSEPSDGDKGDITVSGSGLVWTIDDSVSVTSWILTNPVINTPIINGVVNWTAGDTQIFEPNATNAGINVGSVAGSPSSADPGDLWYDSTARQVRAGERVGASYPSGSGLNFINVWDDFVCGNPTTGILIVGSCIGATMVNTGGGSGQVGPNTVGDIDRPGVVSCLADVTADQCFYGPTNTAGIVLRDGMRWQFGVYFDTLSDGAGDSFEFTAGGDDRSSTTSNADPTDGVWVSFLNDQVATDVWQINVTDGGSGTTADCNATVVLVATFYDWDIWYESGVGVHFILNGTECTNSPINTNLPTATSEAFRSFQWKMDTIESTNQDFTSFVDYIGWSTPLTRP